MWPTVIEAQQHEDGMARTSLPDSTHDGLCDVLAAFPKFTLNEVHVERLCLQIGHSLLVLIGSTGSVLLPAPSSWLAHGQLKEA